MSLELNDLVKAIEEFGVTAAALQQQWRSGGTQQLKTEFDVELTSAGDSKLKLLKRLRSNWLRLKEAKEVVDNAPKVVKGLSKEDLKL